MKVLVPVKRVIDYNIKPRLKADHSGVETLGIKMSINPFDEIAVEEAVRLKEKGKAQEVVVVTIGPTESQTVLRTAMAIGADRGILVETTPDVEPLLVAKLLKAVIERENPSLVIMGKQAIDDDMNATGQILAGMMGWPQGTFVSAVEFESESVTVTREIDGGSETLRLHLPAVLTTDLRLNEPRYATMPNIMRAKKKAIDTLDANALDVDLSQRLSVIRVDEPNVRKAGVRVADAAELVAKLHNEAKVI